MKLMMEITNIFGKLLRTKGILGSYAKNLSAIDFLSVALVVYHRHLFLTFYLSKKEKYLYFLAIFYKKGYPLLFSLNFVPTTYHGWGYYFRTGLYSSGWVNLFHITILLLSML